MDDKQAHLVGRRPAHVAGLAAATLDRLMEGSLDRHDNVAEVNPASGRDEHLRSGPRGWPGPRAGRRSQVRREGFRGQERERQDVGGATGAQVNGIEPGELCVAGEDEPDGGRPGRTAGSQRGRHRPAQRRDGDRQPNPVADRDIYPPRGQVERARFRTGPRSTSRARSCRRAKPGRHAPGPEAPGPEAPPPAARRVSISTILLCGYAIRWWYMPRSCWTNASRIFSTSRRVRSHSSN